MQLTSFKISRYILFILVIVLCTGIIIWTLKSEKQTQHVNSNADNVIRITNSDPCVKKVTSTIYQLWAYTPDKVPQNYITMVENYVNEKISIRTTGDCDGIPFTCKAGQLRKDCDPCALSSARQFAMEQQIVDTITDQCR